MTKTLKRTLLAMSSTLLLIGAQAASAQGADAGHLTLYSKKDQGGEKRVLVANEPDLATMKASNFAWSLTAVGSWEVCMDTGYRAGCRIVTGTITDLGTDGGAISSARKLAAVGTAASGPAPAPATTAPQTPAPKESQKSTQKQAPATTPAPAPAPAPVSTPAPATEPAYLYATVGFGKIKPELVINGFGPTANGVYTATQSPAELDEIYRTGTYGITSGTIEGQMSGDVMTGYWYEQEDTPDLQSACVNRRNGTLIYGRFTLTFNADRSSFSGYRSSCDDEPNAYDHAYLTWTGQLIRRQAAVALPASSSAGTPSASGKDASKDSAENDELVRKAARGIIDRVF